MLNHHSPNQSESSLVRFLAGIGILSIFLLGCLFGAVVVSGFSY